jgi:hypothetical protein
MANKRIRRKKRKQSIISYDTNSFPVDMTIEEVLYLSKTKGILLYSIINGSHKPEIIPKCNTKYFKMKEVYHFKQVGFIFKDDWDREQKFRKEKIDFCNPAWLEEFVLVRNKETHFTFKR